ncbi:site-specific DNA-methyltransferase [Microvirga alba]|uniref:site-specific DNA-methyltransferase (adenine-specific) n=1 Tax=Microvirga alba TaxID=2791025 RepID=A0A931BTS6_9HYPH|nr:site-specific DNA-methyltransferase [Microvirga alba]MBF9234614.1 site-specific DNA-methyltransferase [Microvirga alba]
MPILKWLTRDDDIRAAGSVPYRLLEEVPGLGYGDRDTGNMLIQGDNLDALKALLPFYAGQVKCIYIDPPYNTRSAFEHYDDNLEHSQWLAMIWPRLELLRELLAEDGSIWVSIDDNEGHYLKVVMDEVFGRRNFLAEIIWQKRTSRENRAAIGSSHDALLIYGKMSAQEWKSVRNPLPPNDKGYSNIDNDPRGPWRSIPFSAQGYRPNQMYIITSPNCTRHEPPRGRCWGATEPVFLQYLAEGRVYFPKGGSGKPRIKQYMGEEAGLVPMSLWLAEEVGTTEASKREILDLFSDESPFGTPKPERLMQRIIHIASKPGELVLDSFLGSGTTAAVAHKMGRRYIGIEMGDHAVTHCQPRLKKVVDGEQGGISGAVNWKGGGGFRYFRLGASVFDETGQIRPDIEFPVLAAHVWFSEVRSPWSKPDPLSPVLGVHDGCAYALLYNGILGDKSASGGNVLTKKTLAVIRSALPEDFAGPVTVYGERSALSDASLLREQITFKQTPYDVKARA